MLVQINWTSHMILFVNQTEIDLDVPQPTLRSFGERAAQTLGFEVSGLFVSLPFLSWFSSDSTIENALVLVVLTVAVMIWSPFHNTLFDHLDLRMSGRVASDRPQVWRVVHAVSHEFSSMLMSLPILIGLAGLDLKTAVYVDLGLSAIYALWAWAFFLLWDRLRPLPSLSQKVIS